VFDVLTIDTVLQTKQNNMSNLEVCDFFSLISKFYDELCVYRRTYQFNLGFYQSYSFPRWQKRFTSHFSAYRIRYKYTVRLLTEDESRL
jgi:hypothetical protein